MKPNKIEILNTIWWLWRNQKISIGDVKFFVQDLDLELDFITLSEYKFTSKDKKTTYCYGKQTTKKSH
jgi:hypothetical protein